MQPVTLSIEAGEGTQQLVLEDPQVVIAGFTGRDERSVEAHIAELMELGVPRPETVPAFFMVPGELLTLAPAAVAVDAPETSGEAEPVLVRLPSGECYVGVGSDHTDRALETESLEASKRACAKPMGPGVWPLDEVAEHWDELELVGESGPEAAPYQRSTLADLRRPEELLELVWEAGADPQRPLVVFLGTVSLVDGFRYDSAFRATLRDPRAGRELVCSYDVREDRA
jgi:4-hydroxyphenylacetate 3-monooxygenase